MSTACSGLIKVVLRGTPGSWDARGTRITAVLNENPLTVLYDGRETAARIGSSGPAWLANRMEHSYRSSGSGRGISGQRRFTALCQCRRTPNGRTRFYFEAAPRWFARSDDLFLIKRDHD